MRESFIKYKCYDISLKIVREILEKYVKIRSDKTLTFNPKEVMESLINVAVAIQTDNSSPFTDAAKLLLSDFGYIKIPYIEEDSTSLILKQDKIYHLGPLTNVKCESSNDVNDFNKNLSWMQLAKLMELRSNFDILSKDKEELMFADQTDCFLLYQNIVREICSGEAIQLQVNIVNSLPMNLHINDIGMIISYIDSVAPCPKNKEIAIELETKAVLKLKSYLDKEGTVIIKGIEWKLSNLVCMRLLFKESVERININFNKLKLNVVPATGRLKCNIIKAIKTEYYYGEMDKLEFKLTNVGKEPISKIILGTNYPVFLNMEVMELKLALAPGESTNVVLPFRAALIGNINMMILIRYKSSKNRNCYLNHVFTVIPSLKITASLLRNEMSFTEKVLLIKINTPHEMNTKICSVEILDKSISIQSRINSTDNSMYYMVLKEKEQFTSQRFILNDGFADDPTCNELISREQAFKYRHNNSHFFALKWINNDTQAISLFNVSPLEVNHKIPIYMKLKHLYKVYHDFNADPLCYLDLEIQILNIDEKELSITAFLPIYNGLSWNCINPLAFNNIPPKTFKKVNIKACAFDYGVYKIDKIRVMSLMDGVNVFEEDLVSSLLIIEKQ